MACACCSYEYDFDAKLYNQDHRTQYPRPTLELNRSCQDFWIIPVYVLFWAGMAIIAIYSFKDGVNPERLIYGDDYLGNVCGVNNQLNPVIVTGLSRRTTAGENEAFILTDRPYQFFGYPFNDSVDPSVVHAKPRLCLSSCPTESSLEEASLICNYPYKAYPSVDLVKQGKCFLSYATKPVFNKCVPVKVIPDHVSSAVTAINNREVLEKIFASLHSSFNALLGCLAGAFVLAFFWLILIRFFAPVAVWTTVFCCALLLGTLCALLGTTANSIHLGYENANDMEKINIDYVNYTFLAVFCLIAAIVTLGVVFVIIFNGRNIMSAITLLDETSKVVKKLPFLMITPFVPFFFLAGFFAYFLKVSIYLGAATIPIYDDQGTFTGYQYNYALKGSVIIHAIGFLWTCNFIIAILRVTVAGAVADFYFHGKGAKGFVVMRSFFRAFWYNFGSQLLASFILPVTEIPRVYFAFLKYLSRKSPRLLSLCSCCLGFSQNQLEFINTHSYVMMGIYGYSFCDSSKRGYYLIQSSKIRVGAISCITDTILYLGKLFIIAITTGAGVIYLDLSDETRCWILPIIFLVVASYFVSCCFMDIYVSAAETLLLCFIEDTERNPKDEHHYTQSLRAFLEDNTKRQICNLC